MRPSLTFLIALTVAIAVGGCARTVKLGSALRRGWQAAGVRREPPQAPSAPPLQYVAQTATLRVVSGVKVLGVAPLPGDFVPDMSRAPVWLQNSTVVGVIGRSGDKTAMLGFGGARFAKHRTIAQDPGVGASDGRLLDLVARPDGAQIATAVSVAGQNRLTVNSIDLANPSKTQSVTSVDGEFDAAQLVWLEPQKIALLAHYANTTSDSSTAESGQVSESGLYLISPAGREASRMNEIHCPLSRLAFSPNRRLAVAQGDSGAAPAVLDLEHRNCFPLRSGGPLTVLSWAPTSAAFLYTAGGQNGVFAMDLANGRSSTIAISSGAAAYAADGTIIALGSQGLSWRRAVSASNAKVKAQIALFDKKHGLLMLNSLGFATKPALLARSTMVFSQVSNDGLIDTELANDGAPTRAIIEYSYPARAAFVVAEGTAQGTVEMSWSPDGKQVAIVDGDGLHYTLTVLVPQKADGRIR